MGEVRPQLEPRLEPQECCPSCGRPVAVAGRERCVYCGKPLHLSALPPKDPQIPPEVLLGEDTAGAFRISPAIKWALRWGGIVLAGLILWLIMSGSCAQ